MQVTRLPIERRNLSDITKDEVLEVAKILLRGPYESSMNKAPGWQVRNYDEVYPGEDFEGWQVKHDKNDYYVEFDTDLDSIKLQNDHLSDDEIAVDAKTWFEVVARLNEFGIFHEWQK